MFHNFNVDNRFVCPKCAKASVRLKVIGPNKFQNRCDSCSWVGFEAKETFLTEELPEG